MIRCATSRSGRFTLRLPKGPSRFLHLSSPGGGSALGATGRLSIRVPARSSIRASRPTLGGPGTIRFSGRVRSLGAGFPTRGVVLALQGREDGRWRTFEDLRTNRHGRWRKAHAFRGVPGRYPIRVRIRRQARFPFVLADGRAGAAWTDNADREKGRIHVAVEGITDPPDPPATAELLDILTSTAPALRLPGHHR